jgi:ubiquinone/menaquinone biosynthesis C-methylase UbiE
MEDNRKSGILSRLFLRLRGDSGKDLSRGPLSDRIRDEAIRFLSEEDVSSPDGAVLEVGVGEGLVAEVLLRRGIFKRVVGIDSSFERLVETRRRMGDLGSRFIAAAAIGGLLPFRSGAFGRVICLNTLHNQHSWEDVRQIMNSACSLIGEGGAIVFDMRNARDPLISLGYRFSKIIDPSTKVLPVRAYTIGRVRRLLSELGLEIVRKRGIFYPLWPIPSAYVIEARR